MGRQRHLATFTECRQIGPRTSQFDYHMGSLGGELARDFFWSHEYLRFWSYRNVDLGYLLRRRLYASWSDRLFNGIGLSVSQSEHDTYLLDPFRAICARLQGASKFYVLDILYLLRIGRKMANVWCHAPSKTSMLPFLSKEFLEVALRAPWSHRAGRRLMLETLWRIDSSLCDVPHDSGATMQPMSLSSCGAHMASLVAEFKRKVLFRGTNPTDDHRAEDAVLTDLTHRANELESIGCLPEQGSRLNRWLRVDGSPADRRSHLPALVGLGELLNVIHRNPTRAHFCRARQLTSRLSERSDFLLSREPQATHQQSPCTSAPNRAAVPEANQVEKHLAWLTVLV